MKNKTRSFLRFWSWILFTVYLGLLVYFLFFAEAMGRNFIERSYQYNLIPFHEIRRFLVYRQILGTQVVILNLVGNIVAFFPFGFFLPLLLHKLRYFGKTICFGMLFSVLVETIQLFSMVGSFDVDDIILNTFGTMIGYIGFEIANKVRSIYRK